MWIENQHPKSEIGFRQRVTAVNHSDTANWKVGKRFSVFLCHVYNPIKTTLNDPEPRMTVLSPFTTHRGGAARVILECATRPVAKKREEKAKKIDCDADRNKQRLPLTVVQHRAGMQGLPKRRLIMRRRKRPISKPCGRRSRNW